MTDASVFRLGIVSDAHLSSSTAEPYVWQNTVDLPRSAELLDEIHNSTDAITVERRAHSVRTLDVARVPMFAPDRQRQSCNRVAP